MFWDFLSANPESLYQAMILFSDRGTPYGFRHMNAWTGHTYRYAIQPMFRTTVTDNAIAQVDPDRWFLPLREALL